VLLDRAAAADLVDRGLELFLWLLDRGEPALVRRALEATRMGVYEKVGDAVSIC
jgi:hypothetical protein